VFAHTSVLLEEVLAALQVRSGGRYLDATFGRGGHSAAILERVGDEGQVFAIDRDPAAAAVAATRFANDRRFTFLRGAFAGLAQKLESVGVGGDLNGVLFDLGVSSPQLDEAARGFSFSQDGPLDMRMDNSTGRSAAEWLARAGEQEIAQVIRKFGEERFAGRIARAIVAARREREISRTSELAQIVADAVPTREPGKHPATRTFQAIRIHINAELSEIETALAAVVPLLAPEGRLCVISFHSLEDTLVKKFIQRQTQGDPVYAGLPEIPAHARPTLQRVGGPIHPGETEVARNPRARSAVMRVAQKVAA
jgi:16S rRNA (cytosine1402-N4)-methyltransferase